MSKRKYIKFTSEMESVVYVDLDTVESYEQEGDTLIIHKDSGLWNRILYDAEAFEKLLIENQS